MEIGIDHVTISRFEQDILSKKNILTKIFTENEIKYCEKKHYPAQHYAVRFAAKEAIIKAFSCFDITVPMNQIEVGTTTEGCPFINLLKLNKELMRYTIKLSLSHSEDTAIAFAIITKS